MIDPLQYEADTAARLAATGYGVGTLDIGGRRALVGHKSEFKMRWVASRMEAFVCVATLETVTAESLAGFTELSLEYANRAKGQMRGAQSGVIAIAALAGPHVAPDAVTYAEKELLKKFAALGWPVAVNTTTGTVTRHTGRPMIGAVFVPWIREQIAATLEMP